MKGWPQAVNRIGRAIVEFLIAQSILSVILILISPHLDDNPVRRNLIGCVLLISSALIAWKSDAQRERRRQRTEDQSGSI
ncbi:MAG TPA: hypothetical protein VNQ76_01425 [Planctomicrobium sp.]|nr:hypothetical protein [Planctomicrobium sp.]